jgi:hypothetical protein
MVQGIAEIEDLIGNEEQRLTGVRASVSSSATGNRDIRSRGIIGGERGHTAKFAGVF